MKQLTQIKFISAIILLLLLSACNKSTTSEERGDYGDINTVSAIVTGQVISEDSNEPNRAAKVYFTRIECEENPVTVAKFDSVETDTNGEFTKQISFMNISKMCLESFAELSDGAEKIYSDTVEFVTTLKREPPFDTTSVTLKVE